MTVQADVTMLRRLSEQDLWESTGGREEVTPASGRGTPTRTVAFAAGTLPLGTVPGK
jgi:hypothetical protein